MVSGVLLIGHPGLLDPGEQGELLKGVVMLEGCGVVDKGQPGLFDPGKHRTVDFVGWKNTGVVVIGGRFDITGHSGLVEPGRHLGGFLTGGG